MNDIGFKYSKPLIVGTINNIPRYIKDQGHK